MKKSGFNIKFRYYITFEAKTITAKIYFDN